jgi:hypothetical protein
MGFWASRTPCGCRLSPTLWSEPIRVYTRGFPVTLLGLVTTGPDPAKGPWLNPFGHLAIRAPVWRSRLSRVLAHPRKPSAGPWPVWLSATLGLQIGCRPRMAGPQQPSFEISPSGQRFSLWRQVQHRVLRHPGGPVTCGQFCAGPVWVVMTPIKVSRGSPLVVANVSLDAAKQKLACLGRMFVFEQLCRYGRGLRMLIPR